MNLLDEPGYLSGGSRLRRIYERLQAGGDKAYADAGLNFKSSWFPVYYALTIRDGQTIMQLASQIAFSHITVKNILKELEDHELVVISTNAADKRSKLVSLSRKGKVLQKKLQPLWNSFAQVIRNIFEAGHPDLLGVLSRIDEAMEQESFPDRLLKQQAGNIVIRNAQPREYRAIGKMMVEVYAGLEGFPQPHEQPAYYQLLENVGAFSKKPGVSIIVASNDKKEILGAVVFFADMKYYASGGTASLEKDAAGFRLLAVSDKARGLGIGKCLTQECIKRASALKLSRLVIHTTAAMKTAWKLYEKMGFKRAVDLDFFQGDLKVFGFRLKL